MNRAKIWSRDLGGWADDSELMKAAGLDQFEKYEDIGIQGDGTPVVFTKCGTFGYLDPNIYRFVWDMTE